MRQEPPRAQTARRSDAFKRPFDEASACAVLQGEHALDNLRTLCRVLPLTTVARHYVEDLLAEIEAGLAARRAAVGLQQREAA